MADGETETGVGNGQAASGEAETGVGNEQAVSGEAETGVGNGQAADGRPGNAGLKFRGAAGLEMPGRKSILRPKTGNRVQIIKKTAGEKSAVFLWSEL